MLATDSEGLLMHLNSHLTEISKKNRVLISKRKELELSEEEPPLSTRLINIFTD